MSENYKIRDNNKAYFITMTVVGWIDVCVIDQRLLVDYWK